MKQPASESDQIKLILANRSPKKIDSIFKNIILTFIDTDHCPTTGKYVPVGEDQDGNIIEPNFEEARNFKIGEPWPDDRNWIPIGLILNYLKHNMHGT